MNSRRKFIVALSAGAEALVRYEELDASIGPVDRAIMVTSELPISTLSCLWALTETDTAAKG